jgi:2-polyprenyl-3-methyl-5-hydroxy-6-metoxy-1,4-benzoquinol methylase
VIGPCPACGSSGAQNAVHVREYSFARCGDCATLFCFNLAGDDHNEQLYHDETYFQNPQFTKSEDGGYHGYKSYMADRTEIVEKFNGVLAKIESFRSPGTLLDVGAGPGFLLSAANLRGWNGIGIDLNNWAVQYAQDCGLDVRAESFADAAFEEDSFDAVTMMDLLEHVDDPGRLVAEASRVCKPGAVLAILTPDAGSLVSRALGRRWPELQRAPEHLTLFSVRGLAALLASHGFKVLGWHWIGKTSSVGTLLADIMPVAPKTGRRVQRLLQGKAVSERRLHLNSFTKFCIYCRRLKPDAPVNG